MSETEKEAGKAGDKSDSDRLKDCCFARQRLRTQMRRRFSWVFLCESCHLVQHLQLPAPAAINEQPSLTTDVTECWKKLQCRDKLRCMPVCILALNANCVCLRFPKTKRTPKETTQKWFCIKMRTMTGKGSLFQLSPSVSFLPSTSLYVYLVFYNVNRQHHS